MTQIVGCRLLNTELMLAHGPKQWQAYIRSLEVGCKRWEPPSQSPGPKQAGGHCAVPDSQGGKDTALNCIFSVCFCETHQEGSLEIEAQTKIEEAVYNSCQAPLSLVGACILICFVS